LKFIVILLLFISTLNLRGQTIQVDSLLTLLKTEQDEHQIAVINLQLAKLHEHIDLQKGKVFAFNAISYEKNDSLMAEASNQLGRFYFFTAQLDSASFFFQEARNLLTQMGDDRRVAIINISLGAIQLRQGDYNNTIKTLTESATYFEKTDDQLNAAKCYTNISTALAELGNYSNAIEYNERALQIFNDQDLVQFQLITLPNLAAQHLQNGDTVKAINYNLEAEELAVSMGNNRSLSIIYNNLGSVYLDSDPDKAKDYLEKTINLKNKLNLKSGIEVAQGNLGYLYFKNKDYKTAIQYYKLVVQQVKGKQLVFAYSQLQKCYAGLKDYKTALNYSEKSRTLNDSLLSAENQKVFNEIQTKYETEKKEKEILELQTKNLEVDNKRIRNKNFLFVALGILVITFIIIYFILENAKRKRILIQQKLKIRNQELAERLRTQELNGIDAIIDAQEKDFIENGPMQKSAQPDQERRGGKPSQCLGEDSTG